MELADYIGAFIRWMFRGFRTKFKDELICTDGWIKRITFLEPFENFIIGQLVVLLILIIVIITMDFK